jgi:chemotaxis protein CheZ
MCRAFRWPRSAISPRCWLSPVLAHPGAGRFGHGAVVSERRRQRAAAVGLESCPAVYPALTAVEAEWPPDIATGGTIVTESNQALRDAIQAEVKPMLDEFRRFLDRRISELSAELHAAVQLVDFSEANLSGQIARIHEQIVAVVAAPAAATRNSGLELEAVVQTTEAAAERIMEAAEGIGEWLRTGRRDADSLEAVGEKVNAIFEACTFQDVTGQRIRRAIERLQQVESILAGMRPADVARAGMMPADAARPDGGDHPPANDAGSADPDLLQDAVDEMFA